MSPRHKLGQTISPDGNASAACKILQTLRVQFPQVHRRDVWEEDDCPEVSQNEKGDGGTVPRSSKAVLRFGTPLEISIHLVMHIIATTDLLVVPFVASFDYVYPLRDKRELIIVDCVLTSLFFFGVALRFRTTYVNNFGREGRHVADIVQTTFKSMTFWADVVALASSPFLHMRGPCGILCLLRLLKIWRVPRAAWPQRIMLLSPPDAHVWRLMLDVLIMFFVCEHLFACAWFCAKMNSPVGYGHEWSAWNGWAIDAMESDEIKVAEEGVLIPKQVSFQTLVKFYLFALRDGGYMLSGWGGVETLSKHELILICIMSPLSGCLLAFVSGVFVSAVGAAMMKQEQYMVKSASLNAACVDLHLPLELRNRICKYQSYIHIHNMDPQARELFEELSDNLVGEIRVHRMRTVIEEAHFFNELSANQILSILGMMSENVFAPGDIIFRRGDPADCMYIIARGSVGIFGNYSDKSCFRFMYKGEMVGVAAFLENSATRTAYVRAETFSVLMKLTKDIFQDCCVMDKDLHTKVQKNVLGDTKDFRYNSNQFKAARSLTGCVSTPEEDQKNELQEADENEEIEEVHEMTPLMSDRPSLSSGADIGVTEKVSPNPLHIAAKLLQHKAESACSDKSKEELAEVKLETVIETSRSNSRAMVAEKNGATEISFQIIYGQFLEFREESKRQFEEVHTAQRQIMSMLQQKSLWEKDGTRQVLEL